MASIPVDVKQDVPPTQSQRPELGQKLSSYNKTKRKQYTRWALYTAAVILVTGVVIYHFTPQRDRTGEAGLNDVRQKVGRHYLLPSDEVPALATVTDKSKLATPFFKHAINGDKILVYQKNKLAIIYRPSIDKLIEVGPVTLGSTGRWTYNNCWFIW